MKTELYMKSEETLCLLRSGKLDAILWTADAGTIGEEMTKNLRKNKEFQIKKEVVNKVHVNRDGSPRKITPPSDRKGKKLWLTKDPDGKQISAVSEEALYDKLYILYGGDALTVNYSFGGIFKKAMDARRAKASINGKDKTVTNMEAEYRRFIDESLAKKDIRTITALYLEEYLTKLVLRLHLKSKAVINCKTLMNFVFDYACIHDWIPYNPAKNVKIREILELSDQSLAQREPEEVMLTDEEVETVFMEVDRRANLPKFQHFYSFLNMAFIHYWTGCRPGELCALKWTDIKCSADGSGYELHIHAQIKEHKLPNVHYEYQNATKNEKGIAKGGRYVPLTGEVYAKLMQIKNMQDKNRVKSEYIFCDQAGNFLKPRNYERYISSIYESVGIDIHKGTYAFRHGFNRLLENNNVTVTDRAKIMGHSPSTNMRNYSHANHNVVRLTRTALENYSKAGQPLVNPDLTVFGEKEKSRNPLVSRLFTKI